MPQNLTGILGTRYSLLGSMGLGAVFLGERDPESASDSAAFAGVAASRVAWAVAASDSAAAIGTGSSGLVHHRAAADAATFTGVAGGFDPFLHEFAADSARFADAATVELGVGGVAIDSAAFSGVASVVTYLGRYRRGDKVGLEMSTPSTPDSPPVAVILDSNSDQVAALMMPATNPARTAFALGLPLGLAYGIGSFSVYFHYSIRGASTLQQASFDVVPGGDSGGGVVALYSLDRVEVRCVVAQLDSGVLVLGKTPTVQA